MTSQAEPQAVSRENPHSRTMVNRLKDFMKTNPLIYTWSNIVDDLEEESRESIFNDSMDISRLMVHVQQLVENRTRKHTREGNWSRKPSKNFSRKSSTKIRDKPMLKKELYHQVESISSKGRYDRDSKTRVKRNSEEDTPHESPLSIKFGKLHGWECRNG